MIPDYNVLYIDDEPENLFVFASKFKRTFKVITAQSAAEGLGILDKYSVQLVISDHRMPGMTGVEFLEVVRNKYPDIMRIILTAYTDSDDIINAINKGGVSYFIRKPWNGDELRVLIDKTLAFYNLRQRNKQLVQRLYTTINELEMFYYRVSHDLRGPVASQYGILALARSEKDAAHIGEYLDMLENSIKKLDDALRKIESVQAAADAKKPADRIDFQSILSQISAQMREEIDARGVSLEFRIDDGIIFHSRQNIVYALIENLIENSIHFSDHHKAEKTIMVKVARSDDKVLLEITDNGIGIEQSKIDHIFDAFYRGHAISRGNGLGLYVVKKAVDNLQGLITVESKHGEGTTVLVELPRDAKYLNQTTEHNL